MTFRGIVPSELSVNSIAQELERSGLARMGQGVNPDEVIGLLLLTPQLLDLLGGGTIPGETEGPLPSPVNTRSNRLEELEDTASAIGAGQTADITLETAPDIRVVQIFEVVADSAASDFTVEIFEDADRTRLNLVYQNANITNNHLVDRLLFGQQYRDRENEGAQGQPDRIHIRVTNDDAGAQDITVRIKFRVEPAQF